MPISALRRLPGAAMTGRLNALLAGIALAGTIAALAIADPLPATGDSMIASTDEAEVCRSDGLPGSAYSRAHRVVARKPVPGRIIDHIVPLCLGGADTDANIQLQSYGEAAIKDQIERDACRAVCREHSVPLAEAQRWFRDGWERRVGR